MATIDTKRIFIEMARQELTYGALSEMTGIKRQTLSSITNRGTCSPAYVGKIAKALGIDPSELVQ